MGKLLYLCEAVFLFGKAINNLIMKKYFERLKHSEINLPATVLWLALAVGYVAGLFVILFDDDSAHHAAIALEMFNRGDWACLMDHEGVPYLDKPHFQFWLVAGSFWLFGVGGVAYKLSSFLFTLWGLWATYRLTLHLCGRKAAVYAALILASSAAFALANVDVRMDAILTACIIVAIWQGVMHLDTGRFRYLAGAALGLAMAFGTKGWIGVMVPFFALLFYAIRQGRAKWFVSWKFPALLALFALFISPVLYAYYLQFDAHPELEVRGERNVSGVLFILWGQIFDRMGGTFGKTGASDPFFFLHTLLWAVLPWSFLFYTFAVKKVAEAVKGRTALAPVYWLTLPAIVLTILALSVSQFKLPHYLNVVFPLIAMFVAVVLTERHTERFLRGIGVMQKVIAGGLLLGVALINYVCFPSGHWIFSVLLAGAMLYTVYLLFYKTASAGNIVRTGVVLSAVVWFSLNLNFYPQLVTYQGGNQLALETVRERGIPVEAIGGYHITDIGYSFDVYTGRVVNEWSDEYIRRRLAENRPVYLMTEPQGIEDLRAAGYLFETVDVKRDYRITRLNARFMNPATREGKLTKLYLVEVTGQQ